MVLLKNDGQLLPLAEDLPLLRVAGQGADEEETPARGPGVSLNRVCSKPLGSHAARMPSAAVN